MEDVVIKEVSEENLTDAICLVTDCVRDRASIPIQDLFEGIHIGTKIYNYIEEVVDVLGRIDEYIDIAKSAAINLQTIAASLDIMCNEIKDRGYKCPCLMCAGNRQTILN